MTNDDERYRRAVAAIVGANARPAIRLQDRPVLQIERAAAGIRSRRDAPGRQFAAISLQRNKGLLI